MWLNQVLELPLLKPEYMGFYKLVLYYQFSNDLICFCMKQASGHLQQPDGQEPVRVLLQHPHEKTPSQGRTGMSSVLLHKHAMYI